MATVSEVYEALNGWAPFEIQMDFDNAGFLVGRGNREATKILVALDITQDVACEAADWGAQLVVSHHPVIFHPVRSVTDADPTGRILLELMEKGVAAICAHTNLDAAQGGVNDCLAQALALTQVGQLHQDGVLDDGTPYGIGRVGVAHKPDLSPGEYAAYVKERLGAASVRYADGGKPVAKVAVGGGSCGSMLEDALKAGCDTFVTADVKYDVFLQAKALGINLLDAGHFATENVVCPSLVKFLTEKFPGVEVRLSQRHREAYFGV